MPIRLGHIWTDAHNEWMSRPSHEYSTEALEHALRCFAGADRPSREGPRFSASAVGGYHGEGFACYRASLFAYIGASKLPPTVTQQDNMDNGSALHLHYQMEGISAGYIVNTETWSFDPDWAYGAKDDGVLYNDQLLELKFVHAKKFAAIRDGARQYAQPPGPLPDHLLQVTGNMMLKGLNSSALVYFNKENAETLEYEVPLLQELADKLQEILLTLHTYAERNELPPVRPGCFPPTTWLGKNCAFREHCQHATAVTL